MMRTSVFREILPRGLVLAAVLLPRAPAGEAGRRAPGNEFSPPDVENRATIMVK